MKQLKENNGKLIMDTNPYSGDGNSKIGSFVFHFCEKRHEYQDLGVSPLECILTPLLMKEHYKHTRLPSYNISGLLSLRKVGRLLFFLYRTAVLLMSITS